MRLVYLDTSLISELCQLESGNSTATVNIELWRKLLSRLRKGIQNGAFICPASQFQSQEVLLAPRIKDSFTDLQSELSRGCFFKDWEDILIHQAANQILLYLHRSKDIVLDWVPYSQDMPPIITSEKTVKSKLELEQYALDHKHDEKPTTFAEEYKADRLLYLRETFLLPYYIYKGFHTLSKPSGSFDEVFMDSMLCKLMILAGVPLSQLPEIMEYFSTALVDDIPMVRIHSALYAQLRFKRNYKHGDWLDIETMSSVIPYCAIVTTDRSMKSLIMDKKDFLGKGFVFDIYSGRSDDISLFIDHLERNYL